MAKRKHKYGKTKPPRKNRKPTSKINKTVSSKKVNKLSKKDAVKNIQRTTKKDKRTNKNKQEKKGKVTKQNKPLPSKEKPDYSLYYEGRKLMPVHIDAITEAAKAKEIDVSTPSKLHKFYTNYQKTFAILFEMGAESFHMGTSQFIDEMKTASKYRKTYFVSTGEEGELKEVSRSELIWKVVTIENFINDILGTTFFQVTYNATFDNKIIVKLPSYQEIREMEDMDTEQISDTLLDNYNILVYRNEANDKDEKHLSRAKTYKKSIKNKLKTAKNEKAKTSKTKTKSKKRK